VMMSDVTQARVTSCATKTSWLNLSTAIPCSIFSRSGAFRDVYNLNHLERFVEQPRFCVATSGEAYLARAIQATHAAGQQASTSPAQCANSATRSGARRTAILATMRPAGATEQRVQKPKAWMATRRKQTEEEAARLPRGGSSPTFQDADDTAPWLPRVRLVPLSCYACLSCTQRLGLLIERGGAPFDGVHRGSIMPDSSPTFTTLPCFCLY